MEINGEPVTQEQIQEWADEAERGYDVDSLRKARPERRLKMDLTIAPASVRPGVRTQRNRWPRPGLPGSEP